jgi:probable F420-dependent oxidoreductase
MKLGLRLPTYVIEGETASFGALSEFARKAEGYGFDSLWVVDHFLDAKPSYMCSFMEPLTVLTMVAGVTRRIKVGTSILVLPLRNPALLAKEIATMDWLSNGRVNFGVGVGWNEKEFDACQVPIERRGRRVDEMLRILVDLWTKDNVSYDGKFYKLKNVTIDPKPVQKPHPPIMFGGGSTVPQKYETDPSFVKRDFRGGREPSRVGLYKRIARYGVAWHATAVSNLEYMKKDWDQISKYAVEYGRKPDDVEIWQTTYMYPTNDMEEAHRIFLRHVGKDFKVVSKQGTYLIGSKEEIVQKIADREKFGVKGMIFTPLTLDPAQIDVWHDEILSQFKT